MLQYNEDKTRALKVLRQRFGHEDFFAATGVDHQQCARRPGFARYHVNG